MKRLSITFAVLIAAVSLAASASAEGTGPKVTLRTAAGPLKKGAPLVAFSSLLIFQTSQANVECSKNTFSGIMKTNIKEKLAGELTVAQSRGQSFPPEELCGGNHVNGPATVEWQNLPWKLKLTNTGTAQITTAAGDKTAKFVLIWPHSPGWKCTYATKKWLLSFPVSATPTPLVIETERAGFKLVAGSTSGCATESKNSGAFSVTSNGEPVEVEVK